MECPFKSNARRKSPAVTTKGRCEQLPSGGKDSGVIKPRLTYVACESLQGRETTQGSEG